MLKIVVLFVIALAAFILIDVALYLIYKFFQLLLKVSAELIDSTLIGKEEE